MRKFSWGTSLIVLGWWVVGGEMTAPSQETQPLVAIHDSELTRALDSTNAPAAAGTPTGPGMTGLQWWPTSWHYFVLPEALQEALRADGTAFTVVNDSQITAGALLSNGVPRYPILVSLGAEAIRDDEIAPLTNYVAAGGFLLVGSSAFTRTPNGSSRGDFAFANELGLHLLTPALTNWGANSTFSKQVDHRIVSHIPWGVLTWRMPQSAEEISWGVSPGHSYQAAHYLWQVRPSDATVVAMGDKVPYLLAKPFGKGYFVYHAGFQPLLGHGGFAPGMYAYGIMRKTIEWAFEAAKLPVLKLSPWPFPYDAAFMVRHDLENFSNEVAAIEASAQFEFINGAKGEYYFCTGTLREDMAGSFDTNVVVQGLRRAVSLYQATIGPHNGGLKNPRNPALLRGEYDYWHWGPDEALDVMPTNYSSGKAYAFTSVSNSFLDMESWLAGLTNGLRTWVACYFNATRENSQDILAQLGVKTVGDEKLSPFPHWSLSTSQSGKRYPFLNVPVSDWFINGAVAQSLEPWNQFGVHTTNSMHAAIDSYYQLGALINLYSHTLSTGFGPAGQLVPEYITYGLNTNLHPRTWPVNSIDLYHWSLQRSNARVAVAYTTNASQSVATLSLTGATDTNTAVELLLPASGVVTNLQVLTNGVLAGTDVYRVNAQVIKLRVGTSVTNAQVRYLLGPKAQGDFFTALPAKTLAVPVSGVLANDSAGSGSNLTAILVSEATNGVVALNSNGSFSYSPAAGFVGTDRFTYQVNNGLTDSSPATVTVTVVPGQPLLVDDFGRPTEPGALSPWVPLWGNWSASGGRLQGGRDALQSYSYAYLTNSWTNYSVEARIRFSTPSAWGGGLGGRLNPATGAHYAAWLYPEGSPGGANMLKLLKFQDWTHFGYNNMSYVQMQQVSVGPVGTNWHALKLVFQGREIAVYYDGNQVMNFIDGEKQPYLSGGVCLDRWTDLALFTMEVDEVMVVRPWVCADSYATLINTPLVAPAPGVLANDSGLFGSNLVAALVSGPTHGMLTASSNGGFSYVPAPGFLGTDSFVYQVSDGVTNLGSATVSIAVNPIHNTPGLLPQPDRTIVPLTTLLVTNTATATNFPALTFTYSLATAPSGATIDTNGIITWTPSLAQSSSTNLFTTIVQDNGQPSLSATNSFKVFVLPPLRITDIRCSSQAASITWNSVAGQTYGLQYKTNLTDAIWTDVLPRVTATGSTCNITNLLGTNSQRFYRLLLLP